MSILKPVPINSQPQRKVCPVCGQTAYSREGVHPQCAIRQADEPRSLKLQIKRRAEAKSKAAKPGAWNAKASKASKTPATKSK